MALGLTATAVMAGCLVPQPDNVLEDPIYLNRAPRLINVNPAYPFIEIKDETDCVLQFSVNVADPDIDQAIRVRYYVDYDPTLNQGFVREFVLSNVGQEERPETVVFESDLSAPGNDLNTLGIHVVEAIVFDGTLSPNRVPEPFATIGDGGVVNASYSDVHQWVVSTELQCTP